MGTNYYLYRPECPTCKHIPEPLHIGKSSAGWVFSLHVYPEQGISDLPDWKKLWLKPGHLIRDEYGARFTADEMIRIILDRYGGREQQPEWYRQNFAVPGPRSLARCNREYCQGHGTYGSGTYDLHTGDFC